MRKNISSSSCKAKDRWGDAEGGRGGRVGEVGAAGARIEDECSRTLEFPFSATRKRRERCELSAQLRQSKRNIIGALLGEETTAC